MDERKRSRRSDAGDGSVVRVKRAQVARACARCASGKRRCSGTFPCERCVRINCAEDCVEVAVLRHRERRIDEAEAETDDTSALDVDLMSARLNVINFGATKEVASGGAGDGLDGAGHFAGGRAVGAGAGAGLSPAATRDGARNTARLNSGGSGGGGSGGASSSARRAAATRTKRAVESRIEPPPGMRFNPIDSTLEISPGVVISTVPPAGLPISGFTDVHELSPYDAWAFGWERPIPTDPVSVPPASCPISVDANREGLALFGLDVDAFPRMIYSGAMFPWLHANFCVARRQVHEYICTIHGSYYEFPGVYIRTSWTRDSASEATSPAGASSSDAPSNDRSTRGAAARGALRPIITYIQATERVFLSYTPQGSLERMVVLFTKLELCGRAPCSFLPAPPLMPPCLRRPRCLGIQSVLWSTVAPQIRRLTDEEERIRRRSSCDILLSVIMNEFSDAKSADTLRGALSSSFDAPQSTAPFDAPVIVGGAGEAPVAMVFRPSYDNLMALSFDADAIHQESALAATSLGRSLVGLRSSFSSVGSMDFRGPARHASSMGGSSFGLETEFGTGGRLSFAEKRE